MNVPRYSWGPLTELLLEAAPTCNALDEFEASLSQPSKEPTQQFAHWLLRVRRGKDAKAFPAVAYSRAWRHKDFPWLVIGLSRMNKDAAKSHISDLRCLPAILGKQSLGLETMRLNDAKVNSLMLLLGALDHLSLLADGK